MKENAKLDVDIFVGRVFVAVVYALHPPQQTPNHSRPLAESHSTNPLANLLLFLSHNLLFHFFYTIFPHQLNNPLQTLTLVLFKKLRSHPGAKRRKLCEVGQDSWSRFPFKRCIKEDEFIFVREHMLETLALGGEDLAIGAAAVETCYAREGRGGSGKAIHFDENGNGNENPRPRANKYE